MFTEMDVNGDGEVDGDEFVTFFQAKCETIGNEGVEKILQKINAGMKQFRKQPKAPRLLSDQQKTRARALHKAIDLDNNGQVEHWELESLCLEDAFDFATLDRDGDGSVDREEFVIFLEFMAETKSVEAVEKLMDQLLSQVIRKLEGLTKDQIETCERFFSLISTPNQPLDQDCLVAILEKHTPVEERLRGLLDGRDPKAVVIEDYFKERLDQCLLSIEEGVEPRASSASIEDRGEAEEPDDGYLSQEDLINLCHEILEKAGTRHIEDFLRTLKQEANEIELAQGQAQAKAIEDQQAALLKSAAEEEASSNANEAEAGENEDKPAPPALR